MEAMHVFVRRSYKDHSAALGPMWIICATVPLSRISLKAPKACKLLYDLGLPYSLRVYSVCFIYQSEILEK